MTALPLSMPTLMTGDFITIIRDDDFYSVFSPSFFFDNFYISHDHLTPIPRIIPKTVRVFCALVNPDVSSIIINTKFLTDLYVMIIDAGSRIALSMEAAWHKRYVNDDRSQLMTGNN